MRYFETRYRDKFGICRIYKTKKLTNVHKISHVIDTNSVTKEIEINGNGIKTETIIEL